MSHPDVIVVGLGAMGSASLYQLARRGARVLGIDRFNPPHIYDPDHFPVFIWSHGPQDGFYGFPSFAPDGSVKVATSQFVTESTPDSVERTVTPAEIEAIFEQYVKGHLRGLKPQALRTTTCLYTGTPDGSFVLDRHPEWERLLMVSACSGHGFKHSAAIGEAVAQNLLDGRSDLDLSTFSLTRFQQKESSFEPA